MNKLIIGSILLYTSSWIHAYSPDLLLLVDSEISQTYLDQNSKKKINQDMIQVIVYKKFSTPMDTDFNKSYQSIIEKTFIDCEYKAVAIGSATYFKGRTSNSDYVGSYDNTKFVDGDTGEVEYSHGQLEFETVKNSEVGQKIYKFACH